VLAESVAPEVVCCSVAPTSALDDLARACSFSAGTEVLMADGTTKPISQIVVGDLVLAEDPETGERGARQVTALWVHPDTLVDLEIDGYDVTTTEDHPFWNATDSEWQRADALDPGNLVLAADGDLLTVEGIDWGSATTTTAYNLTVNDLNTYYVTVGDEEVLVHNVCDRMTLDQIALKDLVDDSTLGGRNPLSLDEADIVLDWADEVSYPGWRAGAGDVSDPSNWVGGPHIHIPGAGRNGHVRVETGLGPR